MANFAYQTIGYAGTDLSFSAPTGGPLGDAVAATDGKGFLWVENVAAGGTITVTVHVPGATFSGASYPAVAVTVPDGERRLIGPLVDDLGQPSASGGVFLSITGTLTGVTAAAVRIP